MNSARPSTLSAPSACSQRFAARVKVVGQEPPAESVAALSAALHEFDPYTAEHPFETSELAERVASRLGLSDIEIEEVTIVAALHDLGKIGIPARILSKAGPLTDKEFEMIREHPMIGERILLTVPGLAEIARAIRHEHERWDGAGYPDGLAGEQIPLASRIVLACDAYHAMISDRPYRSALSEAQARDELRDGAGSQFDPQVAEALLLVLAARVSAAA